MSNISIQLKKIQRRIEELNTLQYRESRPIESVTIQPLIPAGESFQVKYHDTWGQHDGLYSFAFMVTIPPEWHNEIVALHLDFSEPPNMWDIATSEGLLFINERPIHAIDRYHREFIIPADLCKEPTLDIRVRMWNGTDRPNHVLHELSLRRIDSAASALHAAMRNYQSLYQAFDENSPTRYSIIAALDAACLALDFRDPRSDTFYASCETALQILQTQMQALVLPQTPHRQPHIVAVGHAHIDVAWLWRLKDTRLKTANTFATALYNLDRFPQFHFLASTPQLYQYVKEDQPTLYERIKDKIATGQWEAEGGMWVEADTNITSGESLIRQFVYGQRFFREEFGRTSTVLWLPDVFGYSAALPQILQGCGITSFMTTKMSWNDTNRFPYDTFWWEGPDGSRVLTQFVTTPGDYPRPFYTYNGDLNPLNVARTWKLYQQKEINNELIFSYGWGDGGGGPTASMIETLDFMKDVYSPEVPTLSSGRIDEFMRGVHEQVATNPATPTWVGELYFEYHRGTYTSQAQIKKQNRYAERDLHNVEWLSTLAQHLGGQAYPTGELGSAWRIILTNQFHDILPGSSIAGVYADAMIAYASVTSTTSRLIAEKLATIVAALAVPAETVVVFNPTSHVCTTLVEMPAAQAANLALGQQLIADDKALVLFESVPGYGYQTSITAQPTSLPSIRLTVTPTLLENDAFRIELNERGQITRILDKDEFQGQGREIIAPDGRANVFQLFEDKPLDFDAWDINDFYAEKSWELDELVSVTVAETGPLRGGLRLEWSYRGRTKIVQHLYIYAFSRRIDFVTEVDWHETQTLLKVAFPVAIHNGTATADIQFGNFERPTHRNTSWDRARFETCAHKWIDLGERDYGVAILNDCKYGYDIYRNVMRLTLLKAAISPDPNADKGHHQFTYSLLPHQGDWFTSNVVQEAYALNYPLLVAVATESVVTSPPQPHSFLSVDKDHIIIETVKKAEQRDDLVVRVYEYGKRRGPFHLHLPFAASAVDETNLLEENATPAQLSDDGLTVTSMIRPYEIKTFLVRG